MTTDEDLNRTRQIIAGDRLAQAWYLKLRKEADALLTQPAVEYKLIGPRLLNQSKKCLDRIYTLAFIYRLDGDRRFAERAKQELLAAAAFKDWNPSHFLDTAEMSHAFAIGYDWLYDFLGEDRVKIRAALIEKGLKPAVKVYETNGWWTKSEYNWNQVCNGGITLGALAVADEEPELAEFILGRALKSIKLAMASYAPDGGWAEGPGYWHYATEYNVYLLAGLESALGTDFGLSQAPGFAATGDFRLHSVGPLSLTFNYADARERAGSAPELFWLARKFNRPAWAWHQRQQKDRPHVLDLVWFDPRGAGPRAEKVPLDAVFHGIDVAFFRSAWEDPQAIYVGFKGGNNRANHSNLDLGDFVLDALGQRWAVDLGPDDYNLPDYFGKKRWTYYRMRTEGQNTLVINGANQEPTARAPLLAFSSRPERALAVADLTKAYPMAKRVWRGIALIDRQRVMIEDEVEADSPVEIVWGMHTPAKVSTDEMSADGRHLMLRRGGAALSAVIVSPAGARFELVPAQPASSAENQNEGVRKLIVRLPEKVKEARVVVVIDPDKSKLPAPDVTPLAKWVALAQR